MKKEFIIFDRDVATLILINDALVDIVFDGEVEPDILDELRDLQPKLDVLLGRLYEKCTLSKTV